MPIRFRGTSPIGSERTRHHRFARSFAKVRSSAQLGEKAFDGVASGKVVDEAVLLVEPRRLGFLDPVPVVGFFGPPMASGPSQGARQALPESRVDEERRNMDLLGSLNSTKVGFSNKGTDRDTGGQLARSFRPGSLSDPSACR